MDWHNCANIVVPDTPRHQTDLWPYHVHGVVVVEMEMPRRRPGSYHFVAGDGHDPFGYPPYQYYHFHEYDLD